MPKKDSDIIWGIPTAVDIANAMAFAQQQVNKSKCQDPDVIKGVCEGTGPGGQYAGGGQCIQWVEDKSQQTFPKPSNYFMQNCATDQDCKWGDAQMGYCNTTIGQCTCGGDKKCGQGMDCVPDPVNPSNLLCGWAPSDVSAGHCIFVNETACTAQGKLPYVCDKPGGYCISRPEDSPSGPKYPYTEWNIDSDGKGKCIIGNFALRQWCENPGSRCEKNEDTGEYPAMCKGSENERGVTDVPPFFYDKNKSQCYITHDYCDVFGLDYNKNSCDSDANCQPGDHCVGNPYGWGPRHCSGPGADCHKSDGQKAGEFFLGQTIFYMFKKNFGCETYEHPKHFNQVIDSLKKDLSAVPDDTCVIADSKKIKQKILLFPNFAGPGINMYMICWENGKNFTGFIAEEVEKVYPQIIKVKKGFKYICMNKEDIKGDKNLKRIYFSVASRGWITENIDRSINKLSANK